MLQTEDCLALTIRHPVGAVKLPVMVWIHGGNHQDGRAEQPQHPHANSLPSKGVVLVKLQYRLGLFGYFAHPDLPHTNFGTWDQVAALRWVQDHIADFGGDPHNVTIFGVSAGGDSVAHMLISPHAAGLFHRAILQSANVSHQFVYWRQAALGYSSATECGKSFADELVGHATGQVERLRAMPAADLAAAYSAKKRAALGPPEGATSDWQGFWPCVDGAVIPGQIFRAFERGRHHQVPIIAGSNSDEVRLTSTFLPCHSFSYTNLKSPCAETGAGGQCFVLLGQPCGIHSDPRGDRLDAPAPAARPPSGGATATCVRRKTDGARSHVPWAGDRATRSDGDADG